MWAYPEIRLLGDTVGFYARHAPTKIAFIYEGNQTSFGELEESTNKVARALHLAGVDYGNRILFFGKNSLDFYLALFGSAKAGICFIPLNWRLAIPELVQVVRDADAHFAIVEREFEAIWAQVCSACDTAIETLYIDERSTLTAWSSTQPAKALKIHIREDDPVIQLYTSGTTGLPKGVLHTHASINHSRLSEHFEQAFEWRDGDVFLCPLPNFHLLHISAALLCLYNGVAIAIQRQFELSVFLAGIASQRPTLLVLTPTMIQLMLDHPDTAATDFSSVRLTMYAGSPISLGLIKQAIAAMPCQFMQFYGQTEISGAVSLLRPDEHDLSDERKLKSCGRPLPLISLRIIDANGNECPDGEPGELLVHRFQGSTPIMPHL